MRKIIIFFFFISSFLYAQSDSTFVDNKYLEDQLYISFTWVGLTNTPPQISRTGFSYGLALGFIKDLPINERRNIGFGLGLGYGLNVYYFNVTEDVVKLPSENLNNRIAMHTIEAPFEFRFRTSTSQKYNFLRVYPGFKVAYVFATNSRLEQREDFLVEDVIEINEFLYGVTLSVGYNKWNFYAYYGLNNLFNETKNNSYKIDIHDIRLGIIFYIL
ncbi:MAG: PorT family protein [Flavobacteriaceae bacterium]|nr:PorT family protein [Flavobacteriaceae bacterium]